MANDESLNGRLCRIAAELVDKSVSLQQATKQFERQYLIAALSRSEGNITRSAEALGIHRNTLRNKVTSLAIEPEEYQPGRRS